MISWELWQLSYSILAYFILFRMLTAVGILITKQISRGGESSCLLMTGLYYPQEHLADKTLMIIIFKYYIITRQTL
jgi:hypothetical protein